MTATLPPPVADPQIAGREPKRVPYVPALDGLRALAVIAVLLYHADLGWIPGGFLGVEVFFVISGYLITLLLIGEHPHQDRRTDRGREHQEEQVGATHHRERAGHDQRPDQVELLFDREGPRVAQRRRS